MSPNLSLISDGKKFMWDGRLYVTREEASTVQEACRNDGFEVRMVEEGGKLLIYTRRTVKGVAPTAPKQAVATGEQRQEKPAGDQP